jgi:dihydroorotate dehydrogenase
MYRRLLKPVFFLFSAERAHHMVSFWLRFLFRIPGIPALWRSMYSCEMKETCQVFGLSFPNRVGLAAGFDKDARLLGPLSCMGFGFVEIGTLTPKPQPGNPKPRLFRLPKDRALINRMGFNNLGVDDAVQRLKNRPKNLIVGGNIGKNKATPNQEALNDYLICLRALHQYVDYFAVNISSPNTPGLRELQEKEPLTELLHGIMEESKKHTPVKPVLLKIAPDLTDEQLDDIIEIVTITGISGIIATNTTISRQGLKTDTAEVNNIGAGGLSGEPVKDRSTEVIRYIVKKTASRIPVIGVGGIENARDAREKIEAGATLIQVYTGFIYQGPGMVKRICKGL